MGISNSKIAIGIIAVVIVSAGAYFLLSDSAETVPPKLVSIITVSDLAINPSEIELGDEVSISVSLENSGNKTGVHTLELNIDGSITDSREEELGPGEKKTVSFIVTMDTSKTYSVKISDLSGSFTVFEPAKFEVTNMSISPTTTSPGKDVTISVHVANIGQSLGEHIVELKVEGSKEKSKTVSLDAGEQTVVDFIVQRNDMKFYLVEIDQYAGRFEVVSYRTILEWGGQGGGGGLFNYPTGIAVDNEGYVYVTDTLNNRVQKFTSDGSFVTMWGKDGYGAGEFNSPLDVDVDNNGFVYVGGGNSPYVQKFTSDGVFVNRWDAKARSGIAVADNGYIYVTSSNSIKVFTLNGELVNEWGSQGTENGQFTAPSGIDVDDEYVYVVELDRGGNNRVQKFTLDGTFVDKWSISATSSSWWPMIVGIAVDEDGNVYVSNTYESSITKFDSNGNILIRRDDVGTGTEEISNPQGICIDMNGDLYVSDRGNYRIKKLDNTLSYLDTWGSFGGSGSGYFTMPLDCDIYEKGNESYIFVNEFWNCRIQKFHLNGSLVSLWGTMGRGSGEFRYPEAIAVDNNGFVYVSDSGCNRVQKFDLDGNFITEWGSYGSGSGQFRRNVGIATDLAGEYVYVVDMGNDRVQKFESDGTFVTQWLTESPENVQYSPRGIAVDDDGYVYVSEEGPHEENSRVQKFTSDGELVQLWYMKEGGSTGTPRLYDIAIDRSDGNLYIFNTRVGEVNKFTPQGELITKWYFSGNGLAVDSEDHVYVVDTDENVLKKLQLYE